MRRNLLFSLIILLLTFLAYANSFENSFHHDDLHVIVRNPHIKDLNKVPLLFLQPQMGSGVYTETSSYRPLLMATFALNFHLGSSNVFGYHLFNFGLHVFCAILVYFILFHLFRFAGMASAGNPLRDQLTALFAALIFALHPVQTESVTYITGRSSLLTAAFFLAAFYAYMQYGLNRNPGYLFLSLLAYAAALLVKETAVTLLPLLMFLDYLSPRGRTWKDRILALLPFVLLSAIYIGIRLHFFGSLHYAGDPLRPFSAHLLTQPRAWVHYLGTLLLPLNLNMDYDFRVSYSLLESEVLGSLFILVALTIVLWRLSKWNRLVGFFSLWFLVTLLPTNSIIVLEDLVSDRWIYLSSVGFAVLFALVAFWIYHHLIEGGNRVRKLVFFFLCALVIELYGFSTILRNFTWTSPLTLWEDAVSKSPQKARTLNALGAALASQGRLEEARQRLSQAIALEPRGGQAYLNLGYVFAEQGKLDKAIALYKMGIPLNPKLLSEIHNNLGAIYFKQEKLEAAEKEFRLAIELRPHNAPPYFNLGLWYEKQGNLDQAISFVETAVQLAPDYVKCYDVLSRLYARKGWKVKSQEANAKFLKFSRGQPSQ